MNPIYITLLLLFVALVLFALENLPVDIIGIILVIGLIMTGVLTAQEGLSGFGDNVIITIAWFVCLDGRFDQNGSG